MGWPTNIAVWRTGWWPGPSRASCRTAQEVISRRSSRLSRSGESRPLARAWPSTANARVGGASGHPARVRLPGARSAAAAPPVAGRGCAAPRRATGRAAAPGGGSTSTRDEVRHGGPQLGDGRGELRPQTGERVHRPPGRGQPAPLRIRVQAVADGAAEQHAHPGHRVRVVVGRPEDEAAGQADQPDQAERRPDPDLARSTRSRPRSRRSSGPTAPRPPGGRVRCRMGRSSARSDSTSRSSAAPWWPTSCTSEDAMP